MTPTEHDLLREPSDMDGRAVPSAKFSLDQIGAYWGDQARSHGTDPVASWSDLPMMDLEIRIIGAYLDPGDQVLDVGCANGSSTIRYAREREVHIKGVDRVPEMIDQAIANLGQDPTIPSDRVSFSVGNALALDEPSGAYDKLITTRMLINLGEWEHQERALHELARVVRPGGLLLLSEATIQGFDEMNAARTEWGLPEIPLKAFNFYLDEDRVLDAVQPFTSSVELIDFSSSYYFGTRVLKPLLMKALGVDVPTDSRWNRLFSEIPSWGRMGTERLFVLRRSA